MELGAHYHVSLTENLNLKVIISQLMKNTAAIASNLAKQMSVSDAVKEAIDYVHCAIADDLQLGKGNGPINHLHKS